MRKPSGGGHERLRLLLNLAYRPEVTRQPLEQLAILGADLDRFTELIAAPGEVMFGVMTRGEGPEFSDRAATVLRSLAMPGAALKQHQLMATLLEHRHAYLKVEWSKGPTNAFVPRASCYFRRRVPVGDLLDRRGVKGPLREAILEVAKTVGKRKPHFIAAAFTRDKPVEHKLYFSQYAEPARRAAQAKAVDALMQRFGMTAAARALCQQLHPRSLVPGEPTFFISISWQEGKQQLSPSLKIDYSDVPPALAASWYDGGTRLAATSLAKRAIKLAGLKRLSYLGVRFDAGKDAPKLKYYVDLPPLPDAARPSTSLGVTGAPARVTGAPARVTKAPAPAKPVKKR